MADLSEPMDRIYKFLKLVLVVTGALGLAFWLVTMFREPLSTLTTMNGWLWLGGSLAIGALGLFAPLD